MMTNYFSNKNLITILRTFGLIIFSFGICVNSITLETALNNLNEKPKTSLPVITPNIASRLGESVLLECGKNEHELLKQLESSVPSMPVLVNWFKHYSLTRRSDKPIYAKYLANNIDYAPHVSRDYENRIQIVNKINLNISSLKATDEALYECRLILFDKAYADSQTGSMFYLQVHVAPEFEYPNEEIVYYKPNIPIRLYCYAKGKPTPSITWYKNGLKLDTNISVLQETFSSSLDDFSSDMFEYKCKVENIVGQIEHTVKVIKSGSLFFTEPLKNLTVAEGTILNWPCLAQSNADITYKWFKNSISVQSVLHKWNDRGALFQDGMLYLLEAYRNDSGLYECHAYTTNKRIEAKAYLNVLYGPEIAQFSALPIYAFENSQSVVLDCVVKSNPTINALEWFKDKYLISNTNKYQILPNNSLLIRNIQKTDRGQYYCSCNNTIKKAVSSIIQLEIVDSKKVEITTLYTSSSQNTFKLPCMPLMGPDTTISTIKIDPDDVKWFKLNSKYQANKFKIESDGSLNLQNVHSSDSGFYYCKINTDIQQKLYQKNTKNQTKSVLQYSLDTNFSNENLKLVKLNVIQNKADTILNEQTIENNDKEIIEKTSEPLPLCPENITINQTKNGILVSWSYPSQTPVKIEYFQIYFREINNEKLLNHSFTSSAAISSASEWKTTESIQSTMNEYFIDDSNLNENKLYEFQLVSFSIYSKSLPSHTIKLKYVSKMSTLKPKRIYFKSTGGGYSEEPSSSSNTPLYLRLVNITQLDIILIVIFVILLFIMILCIVACIAYKRSTKSFKNKQTCKKNKDMDEWGFHTSSGATTSFLSSSSSSERSLTMLKTKSQRNSAIECDLSKLNNNSYNNHYNDIDDANYKSTTNTNSNLIENPQINSKYDDADYYYSKSKQFNINQNSNELYQTSGEAGKMLNNHSHKTIPNKNSSTSSGVASTTVSVTSSSCDSSDIGSEDVCPHMSTINTIKYNAKTNILQQQQPQKNGTVKKIHFLQHEKNDCDYKYIEGTNLSHQLDRKKLLNFKNSCQEMPNHSHYSPLKVSYCTLLKTNSNAKEYFKVNNKPGNSKTISFGSNKNYNLMIGNDSCRIHNKVPRVVLDSLVETSTLNNTSTNPNCSQKTTMTSADSLPNTGDSSGISLNVDTSSDTQDRSFTKNSSSFNSFSKTCPKHKHQLETNHKTHNRKSPETECFNWLNEIGSSSITPETGSSASSTCSNRMIPHNIQEIPINQQLSSSSSSLYSTKISPLPFPTNHFNFLNDTNNKNCSDNKMCSNCIIDHEDETTVTQTSSASSASSSSSSASSSSGCSSLENQNSSLLLNQYYSNKLNENAKINADNDYSEIQHSTITSQKSDRNSIYNVPNRQSIQQQQFLTYKPILKTSLNSNNTNGQTTKKNPSSTNNISTFRSSKIDFV